MKKFAPLALLATVATLAVFPATVFAAETSQSVHAATDTSAAVQINAGKMLYGADGHRIASIYRVAQDGNPQLIIDGRMVTVPASTISDVNGKVTTSLTKHDLLK
jgi:hypothetical protein